MLTNYFLKQNVSADKESNADFDVYTTTINKTIVKLYIRQSNQLLSKVTTLHDDELFGDVLSTYTYHDCPMLEELFFPKAFRLPR